MWMDNVILSASYFLCVLEEVLSTTEHNTLHLEFWLWCSVLLQIWTWRNKTILSQDPNSNWSSTGTLQLITCRPSGGRRCRNAFVFVNSGYTFTGRLPVFRPPALQMSQHLHTPDPAKNRGSHFCLNPTLHKTCACQGDAYGTGK